MDLGIVNLLARMQLAARRRGTTMRVRHASDGLLELIEFTGLTEFLCVEPQRQTEQREDPGGVEEERQIDDPPV